MGVMKGVFNSIYKCKVCFHIGGCRKYWDGHQNKNGENRRGAVG